MKNEIEKRQRDDNKADQESLEANQNGSDETAEPSLSNGVNTSPTKLVAC